MKTFAQNIKDTLPEGASLPAGTQEFLDAPSIEQMNSAARNRLIEVGGNPNLENLRIASMKTKDHNGNEVYKYLYEEGGEEKQYLFRKEGITPHIEQAKKDIPFLPQNTRELAPISEENLIKVGSRESISTAISPISPTVKPIPVAKIASESTKEESKVVSKAVTRAGKMSESTLQGTMDAAAVAVKVMRGVL
jgi:hypothetical protein